jgi:hypothetical protein
MNLAEEENAKIKMQQNQSGMIRKLSRRGTYNTITFSDDSLIPKCLMDNKIPVVPDNVRYSLLYSVLIFNLFCVFNRFV